MVIFTSYVKLPEGTYNSPMAERKLGFPKSKASMASNSGITSCQREPDLEQFAARAAGDCHLAARSQHKIGRTQK